MPDRALLGVDGARQPGVAAPRPPQQGQDGERLEHAGPRRVVRHRAPCTASPRARRRGRRRAPGDVTRAPSRRTVLDRSLARTAARAVRVLGRPRRDPRTGGRRVASPSGPRVRSGPWRDEGTGSIGVADEVIVDARAWQILFITSVSIFLVAMDVTIVSVALPGIRDSFDEPATALAWVFTSYNITFAALLLVGRQARRPVGPPRGVPRRARAVRRRLARSRPSPRTSRC